ncbi:hypothetical protein M072_2409 [Bacteroides fragilis str. DS-208]|nr:hypothetical protein M072_2409 [Bacteroides fragilis str. DS-208]
MKTGYSGQTDCWRNIRFYNPTNLYLSTISHHTTATAH